MARWFKRGYDEFDACVKKQQEYNAKRFKPYRFRVWVSDDQRPDGKDIIFLDDKPVSLAEHYPTLYDQDGNKIWRGNEYICRAGMDPDDTSCYMCNMEVDRRPIGFYTIIDCSSYTNNEGRVIKNTRRLFAAQKKTIITLRDRSARCKKAQKEKKKPVTGLVGARFHVKRLAKTDCREGADFVYIEHEKLAKTNDGNFYLADKEYWWTDKEGNQHPPEVFDYESVLTVHTNDEMRAILEGRVAHGGGSGGGDVFDEQIRNRRREESGNSSFY